MNSVFVAAVSGLQKAETRFTAAAVSVTEAPVEATDLTEAYVEMTMAKTQYEFSAELVNISSEMMDVLLSIQS